MNGADMDHNQLDNILRQRVNRRHSDGFLHLYSVMKVALDSPSNRNVLIGTGKVSVACYTTEEFKKLFNRFYPGANQRVDAIITNRFKITLNNSLQVVTVELIDKAARIKR